MKSYVMLNYNLADVIENLSNLYSLYLFIFVFWQILHFLMTFLIFFLMCKK